MDQYITKESLDAFGITLDDQDESSLIDHLNETLQERIGTEVAAMLDDNKLKELLTLQETADDAAIGDWLTRNVPELSQIIQDEIDILLGEIAESTHTINQAGTVL